MALPKIAEVRKMSDDEIADAILAAKRNCLNCVCNRPPAAWKKPTNSNTPATVSANY